MLLIESTWLESFIRVEVEIFSVENTNITLNNSGNLSKGASNVYIPLVPR